MAVDEGARIKKKGDPEEDSSFSNDISAPERRRVDRWPAIRFDPTEFCDRTGRETPGHVIELDSRPLDRCSTKAARPSVASLRDDKSSVMSNVTGGRAATINATLGLIVAQRFR